MSENEIETINFIEIIAPKSGMLLTVKNSLLYACLDLNNLIDREQS